jgi:SAM-dependent methyltransferase
VDFFELKNIAEQTMRLVNPSSARKLLRAGRIAGMEPGSRVIDFGSGFAEPLGLWASELGVSGVGIDIRPHACERAGQRLAELGVSDRVEIVCGDAANYAFEPASYDVATCIGATFIWEEGLRGALRAMRQALKPGGRIVVGEAYWRTPLVPPEFAQPMTEFGTEAEILAVIHEEGYELATVMHASRAEWDRYESANWRGFLKWLAENPEHPERQQVIDQLHEDQESYLRTGRHYIGWALYVLYPAP